MRTLILIASLLCLASPLESQTHRLRIYVYPHTEEGFVISTRLEDSVKDIREVIAQRKDMTWTFTKESADLTLEVTSSAKIQAGTHTSTSVNRGILGGIVANSRTEPDSLPSLSVILRVKNSDYSQTFTRTDQRFWKDLAYRLMRDDVFKWIEANRGLLQAAR
jgi:hypothetical protein